MAELLVSAPAKINLHLEVLGLRPDGFHELAMVMQMLDLADELRLLRRPWLAARAAQRACVNRGQSSSRSRPARRCMRSDAASCARRVMRA